MSMIVSPQTRRKRKRIVRKLTVAEIALKEVFQPRIPEGFNFAERQYLKTVGIEISKKYRQLYDKDPEIEQKTEPWRFGPRGKEYLVYKSFKVAVYPAYFKAVIIDVLKAHKPDNVFLKQEIKA